MNGKQKKKNVIWDGSLKNQHKRRTYNLAVFSISTLLLFPLCGTNISSYKAQAKESAAVLSYTMPNVIQFSSYKEKLQDAEDAKSDLEQKKKETEEKLAELEKEKEDILTYIEKLDTQLNEITAELEKLQQQITDTNTELEQTQKDLEAAKKTEEKQYKIMKKRIQYMYENGSTDLLETLFSSDDLVDFLNQVEYAKKISEYDNNLFQSYKETKEQIAEQEVVLKAQLEKLSALEENAEFEQETTEKLVADKSKQIEQYVAQIGISDELLYSYTEEITKQEKSIEEIKAEEQARIEEEQRKAKEEEERLAREEAERKKQEAEQQNSSGNTSDTSASVALSDETSIYNMIWPLPGDGRVYDGFGYRDAPTAGASTYHRGVDIGGNTGASIVAVLAGTVEISTYSSSSGNYVIINHGNGVRTAYCHCSKLLVSAGESVKQGKVIALVGSTGISTAPHLHFGVSINNVYVDPMKYISY